MAQQSFGTKGTKADNKVQITLSNPLHADQIARLARIEDTGKAAQVGDTVWVTKGDARAAINSGYATVDKEDPAAVAEVLGGDK